MASKQDPLLLTSKSNGNENKINKWDLIKLKSFCTKKEYKQGENTSLRKGENNSKQLAKK